MVLKKTVFLFFGLFLFLFTDLQGQYVDRKAHSYPKKFALDSNLMQEPWKHTTFKKKDSVYQTIIFNSVVHDALIKKQTPLYAIELNPELLLAAAAENQTSKNYFVSGGGGRLNYQHTQNFVFNASFVAFRQSGIITDSIRTSNNLLEDVFYSESTQDGYKALDLRVNALYKLSKFFKVGFGIDNHFTGDGYHSVIQGNNVPPYPYAKLSTSFWKIDYTVGYHFLKDVAWPDLSDTYRKYMTTHQLNIKLHPRFHVYAWEAIVWKQEDTITQRNYDMSYLNPVIFFRPVEFQLGSPSPDNVLLGIGFRWQPFNWMRVYGQAMVDEFYLKEITARNGWWANKYAFQLGVNSTFSRGNHCFQMRGEFNMARPFTYSYIGSMQNYGTRYTPLAHPLGANFGEVLSTVRWQWKGLGAFARVSYAQVGQNGEVNYGQHIYRSYTDREAEYGHNWLQGNLKSGVAADFRLMYTINPEMNLKLSLGVRKMPAFYANQNDLEEIYLRLSTFLSPQMKQLYQTK